jgi:hypothetical protein
MPDTMTPTEPCGGILMGGAAEILCGIQFIVPFFHLICLEYINSDLLGPLTGPCCITIPTTATSIEA